MMEKSEALAAVAAAFPDFDALVRFLNDDRTVSIGIRHKRINGFSNAVSRTYRFQRDDIPDRFVEQSIELLKAWVDYQLNLVD